MRYPTAITNKQFFNQREERRLTPLHGELSGGLQSAVALDQTVYVLASSQAAWVRVLHACTEALLKTKRLHSAAA
jgi:hypothetical protein